MRPLLYLPAIAFNWALALIGLPLIALLLWTGQYHTRPSQVYAGRKVTAFKSPLFWLWGNEEDGVLGPEWYAAAHPKWGPKFRGWMWSAIRNPVNNDRFIAPIGVRIDPTRVRSVGNCKASPQDDEAAEGVMRFRWSYTVQGAYSGLWVRYPLNNGKYINFRIGWKLLPKDKEGVPDYDYRKPGCGFGLQLQLRPSKFPNVNRS